MSQQNPVHIQAFLTAVQTVLAQRAPHDRTVHQEFSRILGLFTEDAPPSGVFQKSELAMTAWIREVLQHKADSTRPLAETIAPIAHVLPWSRADDDTNTPSQATRRAAKADLVGPSAALRSPLLHLGLTLIAPNTLCPSNHHLDAELSHVVAGNATWVINGIPKKYWAGSFIVTPPQAVHAIHTEHEPVLALCLRKISPENLSAHP